MKTLSVKLLQRSDTEKNWESTNPVLGEDELGFVKNSGNFKIGDGSKKWSELPLYESLSPDDRSKLDGIASGANKTTVDSALSSTSTNPVQNKVVNSALAGKSNTNHTHDLSTMINTLTTGTATPNDDDYYVSQYAGGGTTTTTYHRRPLKALFEYIKSKLHKVAISGSYNDLSNKPTIPSVGNGTITIKQAGAVKGSFTTNQSGATTIELTDNNTNTWRDVIDNLTSTATDKSLSAKQGKLLNDNKVELREWSTQIKCATWSRLCYVKQKWSVIGSSFILNISGTRNSVLYNDTFVIKVHHSQMAIISKISGSTYSTGIQVRVVSDSSGNCYVEMYENVKGATNTTTQTVYCSLIDIACGEITTYTSFTDGSSIPTGFTSNATITTNSNSLQGNLTWGEITGKPSTYTPSSHTHTISQITDISNASVKKATTADSANSVAWGNVSGKPSTFTPSSHTHDDRYYTESEVDSKLSGKANTSHNHTISQITDIANASVKSATSATTAASAQSVEWNNVKNKPSTYTPSSHSHDNSTITSVDASKITTGTIDIARLPQGALERCVIVADDTARFKLTTASVQKGDTVKVTGTGKMYFVIDDTKLSSEDGYTVYTAGSATSAPWSGITGKPATYPPSSHNHDDKYVKLDTGGALNSNAIISWKDTGNWNNENNGVTFPVAYGGLQWSGQSDGIKLFAEETTNDNLELVLQFTDDNSNGLTFRDNKGATVSRIDACGNFTGKANTAGTADVAKVANSVTWANVSGKPSTFTPASHTHNYAGSASTGGAANSANVLNDYFSGRQTSANLDLTNSAYANKVSYMIASSSMTTGKPPSDAHILTFGWDTTAGWGAQMAIGDGSKGHIYTRGIDSVDNKCSYGSWKTVLDSENYNTYAPTKTGTGASGTWGISVTGNAATATKLSSSAGSATRPVYFNDGKPVAGTYTLANACSKTTRTLTNVGASGWEDASTDSQYVPDMAFMAYWNGAYSNTSSNLAYCNKGAFGTAATKNIGDFATSDHTHTSVKDSNDGEATTFAYSKAGMNYGDYNWVAAWNGKELRAVNKTQFATAWHNHDSTYLKLSGGTMTGALNFKNNTWNALGDDVAIGDHNKIGSLGIKGLNSTPKATFVKSDGTVLADIGSSTVGKLETSATSFQLGGGATITYNSTNKCIDFTFN